MTDVIEPFEIAIDQVVLDDPARDDAEQRALAALAHYQEHDSGYSTIQSTRPQTIGYDMTDSPAGQAAWILEKLWAWTDCDGHPENVLTRDEILDSRMMHWVSTAATPSARLYWDSFTTFRPRPVPVPTGVAAFPGETLPAIRRWCEPLSPQPQHWTDLPRGGHFAAFEQPGLHVDDVRAFFGGL
jgi:pimeloyl-ACP methyl ester carboxylesterase